MNRIKIPLQSGDNLVAEIGDSKEFKEILDSDTMVSYLNEYIPLATAEIILRCDLDNLLNVYLENCPRIKDNIGILRNIAEEVKAEKCLQVL